MRGHLRREDGGSMQRAAATSNERCAGMLAPVLLTRIGKKRKVRERWLPNFNDLMMLRRLQNVARIKQLDDYFNPRRE